MDLYRTVCEINGDFSRKSQNFPHPMYLTPRLKGFPLELGIGAWSPKQESCSYRADKEVWRYLQPSGYNTPTQRTNTRTPGDSKDRAYAQSSAVKNGLLNFPPHIISIVIYRWTDSCSGSSEVRQRSGQGAGLAIKTGHGFHSRTSHCQAATLDKSFIHVPSASEVTPVWHRSYLNLIQLLNLITVRLPLNNFSFFGSTLSVRNLGQLYRTRCCAGIVQILSSLEHHSICEYFHQLFISKALHEDHSSNMFHSSFSHIRSGRKTGVGRPGKRAEHLESARSALLGVWSEGSSEFEGPKNPLVRRFGGDPEASTFFIPSYV